MSQSVDRPPPAAPRRGWKTVLWITLALALFVPAVAYFCFRPELSPAECEQLEQKKNIAIGYLENGKLQNRLHKLPEADELFREIARLKPGDPLPLWNLAITRIMLVSGIDAGRTAERATAGAKALEAAHALLEAEPSSPAAHLLASQTYALVGDEAKAIAELNRAAELAPNDVVVWYELFNIYQNSRDKQLHDKAASALSHAYQLAPDNLSLQLTWLETQIEIHDANLKQTITRIQSQWSSMPGLLTNMAERSNRAIADPNEWLGRIAAAAEKGDWRAARGLMLQLGHVARPEPWIQSDLRRLQRDPLEYVIHDFQSTCPRPVTAGNPQPTKVKLVEFPAAKQPPPLAGIRDMALADFDLDGRLDLIVLRTGSVEVYSRNHTAGWRQTVSLQLAGDYDHLLAADLDRDDPRQIGTKAHRRDQARKQASTDEQAASSNHGPSSTGNETCHLADLDLIAYGPSGIVFLENQLNDDASRSFVEKAQSSDVAEIKDVKVVVAADFYHDGDLDVALIAADGLHLWSNRGDLTFSDITGGSKLPDDAMGIIALVAVDWDHDVDLDLLAANDIGKPAGYLENLRHGQFRWRPYEAEFDAFSHAKSVIVLDADANGAWRFVAAGAGASLLRTQVSRAGVVSAKGSQQASSTACDGVLDWDFDNDGNLDLVAWNEKGIEFLHGADGADFAPLASLLSAPPQSVRVCRAGDLDNDGDEDLALVEADRLVLYSNEGGNALRWLDVELQAGHVDDQSVAMRSDHYGIGCIVEVRSGSHVQRRLVESAKTHFGLGQSDADLIRVIWTTGIPQDLVRPDSNVVICDEQVLGGSCPFLYTWNGERFEFCTDCLWSAPLGLLLAEGQVAPSREWEYLRIDGDKLRQRDGCYPLQITEELWEAAYLDEIRLIAVDHPAEVEVYSNEKVGPAELARHKVHTVRNPVRPVAARDQQGRDLLGRLGSRDGKYVKAFDHRLAFGLADDHFIELDFGRLSKPQQITLFLTGWIRPTGTSVNVGISQNPGLKKPAPPSLWTPDASGEWRQVLPYMGFPGGKTKTIAVDLSDVFSADDYRLRVATNMEIYWDEAFITVDEPAVEVRQTPLELIDADLHYRGFSRRTADREYGPEHFEYDDVTTRSKWPAMRGNFTRYGDVSELVTATDDLLAVLGAGDELTLRFAVPDEPPPPGWKRDFLLFNVGWDKDCDLNTIYGETVEPLPFQTG
ncbi:MAG TPA: FG-GAP-like repeat-containing protein, partial [Pirellulales bacterium]|nr:FG-GAP-like repeat-containing protein [Pirellulales bacterium]